MLRKSLLAVFTLVVCVGISLSDEIRAIITKVDGSNVTFTPLKGKGKNVEKGEAQTLPVASDVKVTKGMFNKDTKKVEPGEAIEGGLKAKLFTDIGEKGVNATLVTSDDGKKITGIIVGGKGKKKNQ